MSTKAKEAAVPADVGTLARWLADDPKGRLSQVEALASKASAEEFERRFELLRVGLKWAWDEQPEVFFNLTRPWFKASSPRLRRLAVGSLPLSSEEQAEACSKLLKKLATDKDRDVRLMAVDMLAEDVEGNLDLLRRWAKDEDPKVRELVARHSRTARPERLPSVLPLLETLVLDPEPEVHWAAIATLLELYPREPRPVLDIARTIANAADEQVRAAAASMFFEHLFADHFNTLLPTIRAWLRAGDPHLRWTLVRSLRFTKITPHSLQLLRALYEDKDPEIRRRAVQVLLRAYDPAGDHRRQLTDLLRRASQDQSKRVRELVEQGIELHGEDYLEPVATPDLLLDDEPLPVDETPDEDDD